MTVQERELDRAPARPAAVLWDMDGTLVDTEPHWIAAERDLVADHGGTWTDEHAHAIVGFDLREAAAYIRDNGGVDLPVDDIVNRLLDGVIARLRQIVPWRPGARELLRDLRAAKVPCALVTMSWRRFADAIVAALPAGSFDVVIAGDDVTNGKPHPEPYLTAAARLGLDARDCIALEDSPTGVRSAEAAGCRVYAVPSVVAVPDGPGHTTVRSLTELTPAKLGIAVSPTRGDRRRRRVLGGVAALAVVGIVAGVLVGTNQTVTPPPPDIPVDAWAPYWTVDASTASIAAHGAWLRDVSPFWYAVQPDGSITAPATLSRDAMSKFLLTARGRHANVIASITDGLAAGQMAALLAEPSRRAAHVQSIVALVQTNGFDGIDIDYEKFAFADARSTWEATRPNWVAFLTELAAALHPLGKQLTVSTPYIRDTGHTSDSGYWVYDYAAMGGIVDRIRILAYDYSTAEPGPVAPLSFVREAVKAAKAAVGDDSRLVLGVALHGYNWPISTTGTCPTDADSGITTVSQATVDDLVARRHATPVFDAVTGESSFTYNVTFGGGGASCTQTREVHYVDAEGARERIDLARRARLGGVSLWALGFDSAATWSSIGALAQPPSTSTTNASTP